MVLSEEISAGERPVCVLTIQIDGAATTAVAHLILIQMERTTATWNIVVPIVTQGLVGLKHAIDGLEIRLEHANGPGVRTIVALKGRALHRDIHGSQGIDPASPHVGTQRRSMIGYKRGVDNVQHHIAHIDDAAPAVDLGAL